MRGAALLSFLFGCGRVGFELCAAGCGGRGDPPELSDGLVAHFALEGRAADGTEDASPSGLVGFCFAPACPTAAPGVYGAGYAFDGVDDVVRVTEVPGVYGDEATIAFWLYADADADADGAALSQGVMSISYNPTTLTANFQSAYPISITPNPIPPNTWQHVAVAWDATRGRLFVGGFLAGIDVNPRTERGGVLLLGAQLATPNYIRYFPGRLDDVRVYDRQLTDDELAVLATR